MYGWLLYLSEDELSGRLFDRRATDRKLAERINDRILIERGFEFIKKNAIHKEKCEIVTKVKLQKFTKHNNRH